MLRKRPRHPVKLETQIVERLTESPLTRNEIAKHLGLKKSVVSGVVGLLIGVGAVKVIGMRTNPATGIQNQVLGVK